MGQFPRKLNHRYIIKRYKKPSELLMMSASYFKTSYYTISLWKMYFGVLHKHSADVTNTMGFKTSTTSGRSIQIASTSVYTMYKTPFFVRHVADRSTLVRNVFFLLHVQLHNGYITLHNNNNVSHTPPVD